MTQDASRPADAEEGVVPEPSGTTPGTAPGAADADPPAETVAGTQDAAAVEAEQEAAAAEQEAVAAQEPAGQTPAPPGPDATAVPEPAGEALPEATVDEDGSAGELGTDVHPDTVLAAERLLDLQRLQAEYVNYKRRVDRDRAVVQERAVRSVIEALLPVLDDISAARDHGDLEGGPFAAIADKLESALGKFGLERYGSPGEPFDPLLHEALMHTQAELPEGTQATTVVQVLQPGYRAGDQVLRAARVAVADPQ